MAPSRSSRRKPQYAALQPRTLNISQSAIRKKWTRLPESSQFCVKELFRSIERSVQHKAGGSDVDAQFVVDDVVGMLTRKLPRMPFPPRTDEAFFDYEATLNRTRILEAQLTTDAHSAGLLKTEIERERRLLDEDRNELQQLERALRDEEARRRRHSKGLHPLANSMEQDTGRKQTVPEKSGIQSDDVVPLFLGMENGTSLEAMLQQLHSHLDSMQNNTASIKEIPAAITSSQSALDSFTWRFLDTGKYGKLHGLDLT